MSIVDLHMHSTYSDGLLRPVELVARAVTLGFSAISLTDHDNVDGIDELMVAAQEKGVDVVSGVELSVEWEKTKDIHLLGYGFDHHNTKLCSALQEFRDFRKGRNRRIVEKINERLRTAGIDILEIDAIEKRAEGTFGRPHIAAELLERGVVKSFEEAFARFLVPCNEPKRFFPLADAIALIHQAGGVAVLAHPSLISISRVSLKELIEVCVSFGLDGIEVFTPKISESDLFWLSSIANQHKLIITGGSDFHTSITNDIDLWLEKGKHIGSYSIIEEINSRVSVNLIG